MIQLINQGFPKDKMIIHSDTALLEELNLSRIHFKENVKTAFAYKKSHPEIQVGMSTHSIDTIYTCIDEGLDYVFTVIFSLLPHIRVIHHVHMMKS